ncbi:MAG: response regulator transcription factor [Rikenellaceae bacterium]
MTEQRQNIATIERRKVILVDDHILFREGLRGLLERYANVEVIGEASDGDEFLEMIETMCPDVVFMDISMERVSGDVATQRALSIHPELRIITLSMFGAEIYYSRMVKAGASGFLLKNSDIGEVIEAIDCVCAGGSYFSSELMNSMRGALRSTSSSYIDGEELLSNREREILVCVCKGFSNQEIADELFISKRTVDKHRANIMEKTGCKNTANLVVYAIKNCLIDF